MWILIGSRINHHVYEVKKKKKKKKGNKYVKRYGEIPEWKQPDRLHGNKDV